MESLTDLLYGFSIAIRPENLFFCFLGCLVGTLIGVLPGIGATAGLALLLPLTFHLSSSTGIIMLAGIYYGAMYGGSTTSILVNIPGEGASLVTCFDGYQMARMGRAGPALGIAAIGSFIAGTAGVIVLMFVAPPLASFALKFSSPEYAVHHPLRINPVELFRIWIQAKGLYDGGPWVIIRDDRGRSDR